MDKSEFYSQIFSMGLTIGEGNTVYAAPDKGVPVKYFKIADDILSLSGGGETKISVIETMSINNERSVFTIETVGDKTIEIRGAVMDPPSSRNPSPGLRMPKTDSELADLFPILYPDYTSKLFYDTMMEREIIDISLFDPNSPEGTFVDMDESVEIMYYDNIERKLKDQGYSGTPPPTTVRLRVLLGKIYSFKRNLFKEWVLSHKWDGVRRVDSWFKNVFGATAPPLQEKGFEDIYLAKVSRAWFTGAIRRMDQEIVHEIVPVLISPQGKCRKTSGLRYTAGKDKWFKDVLSDVTSTQGVLKFLDAARGKVVIELAESTAIRTKDQDSLKGFISMSSDQYRKPYARREQSWPRHFILAATSNLDDVFTDLTGNRRYYPMYCTPSDFSYRTKENVEQVWAEAYILAQKGEPSFIDSEWLPAKIMQSFATQENPHVSMIDSFLNDPMNGFTNMGRITCKEEILQTMYKLGPGETITRDIETAYRAWRRGTYYWTSTAKSVHYGNRWVKGLKRIKASDDSGTVDKLPDEPEELPDTLADVDTLEGRAIKAFNNVVVSNNMTYENEVFNPGDMAKECLDWLLEHGYIYEMDGVYRVVSYE